MHNKFLKMHYKMLLNCKKMHLECKKYVLKFVSKYNGNEYFKICRFK